jgi:transcription initiation factor TFIIB
MNERQQAALARVTDALDAPENVRELAHAVAHRAFTGEFHMGRSVEPIAASAVYAAFRRDGDTRTLDEVSAEADVDRTALGRSYKHLADELDIDLEPVNPHEFVGRFAASLDVADGTETTAHEITEKSVEAGLHSGVPPAGIAAGALYLADRTHHDRLSQQEVAEVTDVSVITIRHRYAEQAELLGMDVDGKIAAGRWKHLDSNRYAP